MPSVHEQEQQRDTGGESEGGRYPTRERRRPRNLDDYVCAGKDYCYRVDYCYRAICGIL